ncbi:PRD domain-containing protein [Solobacterium moorei]|nr:PRD domain-containing protein [Solobacterium moorei]
MISFSEILKNLNLEYSNELATKFLCHSVNMIERVIKNDTFKYQKVREFIEENNHLYRIIENSVSNVNEVFGITVPKDELAYIAEIFLL